MTRLGSFTAVLTAVVVLAGCGSSGDAAQEPTPSPSTPTPTSTSTPSATPTSSPSETESAGDNTIRIVFEGDTVTPNGERVEVAAGEDIVLRIVADAPGELHIHSSPEQEIAYDAGSSMHVINIDRPGIVDVESHDLGIIVVQLEVR